MTDTIANPNKQANGQQSDRSDKMLPTQFYEILPDSRMRFRIDNHRLNTFGTCGQLFKYAHMDNFRGKKKGVALSIGAWWSRVLELFYNEMSYGTLPTLDMTLKFGGDAFQDEQLNLLDPKKFDQGKAILMITDYYYKFAEQDFRNWKVIGTEVGFGMKDEVMIIEDNEVVVNYVGKPDLVVFEHTVGKLKIVDHKTTDYIKGDSLIKWKPHSQTAGYVVVAQYLAQHEGYPTSALTDSCIINMAARNAPSDNPKDGVKKPRFIRAMPNYSPAELEEWRRGLLAKCKEIKRAIVNNEWIRRENSCHIYGGCQFRGVCSVPPVSRDIVLKADFVKSDPWVPYETEDEQ